MPNLESADLFAIFIAQAHAVPPSPVEDAQADTRLQGYPDARQGRFEGDRPHRFAVQVRQDELCGGEPAYLDAVGSAYQGEGFARRCRKRAQAVIEPAV